MRQMKIIKISIFTLFLLVLTLTVNAAITDNLVAVYDMRNTSFSDILGNYNSSGTNGTWTSINGKYGNANNGTSTPRAWFNANMNFSNDFSINYWTKLYGTNNRMMSLISCGYIDLSHGIDPIYTDQGLAGKICLFDDVDNRQTCTSYTTTNDTWYMITITNDNLGYTKHTSLYVNGDFVGTVNHGFSSGGLKYISSFGGQCDVIGISQTVDELYKYSTIINSSVISELYNGGAGSFYPTTSDVYNISWNSNTPFNNSVNNNLNLTYYFSLGTSLNQSNCSLYWNNTNYQTINNLNLTTTYGITVVKNSVLNANISSYVSCVNRTQSIINSTTKYVYWNISTNFYLSSYDDDGNALSNVNYTFNNNQLVNLTGNTSFQGVLATGNYSVIARANGYAESYYFITINQTEALGLSTYLIPESDAFIRQFVVKDVNTGLTVPNAYVSFLQNIMGTYVTVSQKTTDYVGVVSLYLNPLNIYLVRINHPSYLVKEINFQPTDSSYTIYIGSQYNPDYTNIMDDISYSINPVYLTLYQNSSYIFNFSISSSAGTLEYWGLKIIQNNTVTIQNTSILPNGGVMSTNITTAINSTYYLPVQVTYFFKKSGYDLWTYEKSYLAYPNITGNMTLVANFKNLKTTLGHEDDNNNWAFIPNLLTTFITIGLCGLIGTFTPIKDLQLLSFIGIGFLAIFAYLGFFNWIVWSLIALPYMILQFLNIGGK